jgi:hypothetical protein
VDRALRYAVQLVIGLASGWRRVGVGYRGQVPSARLPVRIAHYDGLGVQELVDPLRVLEHAAGVSSDLGWVSSALQEPTFTLVTVARQGTLCGYATAVLRGGDLQIQRLVTLPAADFGEADLHATLVHAVRRVGAHPPYRTLRVVPGLPELAALERSGWRVIDDAPADDPAAGPALRRLSR